MFLLVGEVALLLATLHHGMRHRTTADHLLDGAEAVEVEVEVVNGVDGVVDRLWLPSQRLRGLEEVEEVLILGLNHPRSFLSRQGVVSQLP